jgi:hypothetical protein
MDALLKEQEAVSNFFFFFFFLSSDTRLPAAPSRVPIHFPCPVQFTIHAITELDDVVVTLSTCLDQDTGCLDQGFHWFPCLSR